MNGVSDRLDWVPDTCGMVHDIAFIENNRGKLFFQTLFVVLLSNVHLVVRLMSFCLRLKVTAIFVVWRESKHGSPHTRFGSQAPFFRSLQLKREIFLEVNMPVRIVALSCDEKFNFCHWVTCWTFCCRPRKVICKIETHLVAELFAVCVAEFRRRCQVERSSFFVGFEAFTRVVWGPRIDSFVFLFAGELWWLPDHNVSFLIGTSFMQQLIKL